jgi:protein subunit release factor A
MDSDYKVEVIYEQTGTTEKPPGQFPGGSPKTMVRVTHIETGIMAQSGKLVSPFKNKQLAIDMIEHALKNLQDQ